MKDKTSAALLALLLWPLGAHKFYLGRTGAGIAYLVLSMTVVLAWIPGLLGLIDFIVLALMDKDEFDRRYNGANMLPGPVVVNMLPSAPGYGYGPAYGAPPYGPPAGYGPSPYGPGAYPPAGMPTPGAARNVEAIRKDLEELNEMRIAGLLTEEEFAQQKARLLGM